MASATSTCARPPWRASFEPLLFLSIPFARSDPSLHLHVRLVKPGFIHCHYATRLSESASASVHPQTASWRQIFLSIAESPRVRGRRERFSLVPQRAREPDGTAAARTRGEVSRASPVAHAATGTRGAGGSTQSSDRTRSGFRELKPPFPDFGRPNISAAAGEHFCPGVSPVIPKALEFFARRKP
jgi:hypothetical protein